MTGTATMPFSTAAPSSAFMGLMAATLANAPRNVASARVAVIAARHHTPREATQSWECGVGRADAADGECLEMLSVFLASSAGLQP